MKVDYSEYYRVYTPSGVLYATYDAPWPSDSNRERALAKVAELQSMGTCQGVDIQNGQ